MTGSGKPVFLFLVCLRVLIFALNCARLGGKKYRSEARMIFFQPASPTGPPCSILRQKATFAGKKSECVFGCIQCVIFIVDWKIGVYIHFFFIFPYHHVIHAYLSIIIQSQMWKMDVKHII